MKKRGSKTLCNGECICGLACTRRTHHGRNHWCGKLDTHQIRIGHWPVSIIDNKSRAAGEHDD